MKRLITSMMLICLVLGSLGLNACGNEVQSTWKPKEPTKYQLAILERIYDDLYSFDYFEDEFKLEWQGPLAERFDQICGEKINITVEVDAEDYQLPEETLRKKRGDCTDFANLFVSAARAIGISARVVMGRVETNGEELEDHSWCEFYYQGKWRTINPRAEINEEKVLFRHQLSGFVSLQVKEAHSRYDEKIFEGKSLIEFPKASKEANESSFFNDLSNLFRQVQRRKPSKEELSEFKKMAKDMGTQVWMEIIKYIPENPHTLIQPNNPLIKAWVEKMASE